MLFHVLYIQDMAAYLSRPVLGEGKAEPNLGSVDGAGTLFVECKQRGIGMSGSFVFNTRLAQHSGPLHRRPPLAGTRTGKQVHVGKVKRKCVPIVSKAVQLYLYSDLL